ncbi:uncharacterized protein LOC100572742 [Acyrthosiphon pisum]|uniref:Uncharacterized protein n=1 Tax=Acyrthosiphon pisum TaxID=7029 RepID=A0A8R1WBB5_ACYPI|nr:uncharacterized protein LOC100572742 [Acyrthosiphon pisum]|eukprot:XP_003245449.1 PREDICTED: uncharacterized protein LOC100572742 [Acyrthosiphon pisum]
MSCIRKKKSGCNPSTQTFDQPIQSKSKKQINKKENVRKEIGNKLGPVRHVQQIQANVHKYILEMGSTQEKTYFEPIHQAFNQRFKHETEILMGKIKYQLEKDSVFIRTEYDEKLLQDTKYQMNKFNDAVSAITMDLNNKCEEKQKQYKIDAENMMYTIIEKYLTWRERYIKQEFGYFKEQNLADFKEYYRRLILSYRLRFEKKLDDIEKKHRSDYEKIKQSSVYKYKKNFDLEKKKLEEKLLLEKPSLSSVFYEEKVEESEPHIKANIQKNFKC